MNSRYFVFLICLLTLSIAVSGQSISRSEIREARKEAIREKNEQKQAVLAATGGIVGGTTVANVLFKGGITRMNPLMFFGAKLKVRRFDA